MSEFDIPLRPPKKEPPKLPELRTELKPIIPRVPEVPKFDIPLRPRTLEPPKLPELRTELKPRIPKSPKLSTELGPIKELAEKIIQMPVVTPPKVELAKELAEPRPAELDPKIKELAEKLMRMYQR
jgi:hypothetical protein